MAGKLFLVWCSVLLALATGEIVLRSYGFGRPLTYVFDPVLLWTHEPNQRAYTPTHRVPYEINSSGLRDTELVIEKPEDEFRVLVLGDSVVFGQGIEFSHTFVQRLELILAESGAFNSVQVINAGVSGYGPQQERRFLEREGINYRPDLVILGFCHNDILHAKQWNELETMARESGTALDSDRWRQMSAWTHLISGLYARIVGANTAAVLEYLPTGIDDNSWDYTIGELREMARFLKGADIPFVVVLFPIQEELDSDSRRNVSPLQALADQEAIYLLDLYPALAEHRSEGLFLDPVHPNRRGNELAAQATHGYLVSNVLRKPLPEGALSRSSGPGAPCEAWSC